MTTTSSTARHIGILLANGTEELDAIGPWQVFAWWVQHYPAGGYAVTTFSVDGGQVTCGKGLRINPEHSTASVPPLDVLVHPGGGTNALRADPAHLEWLREQRRRVPLITSVCSGATVLAEAGLLHGRPATSDHVGLLQDIDNTVTPRTGVRYVDDGDVITSAGVAAGIDMALHMSVDLPALPVPELQRLNCQGLITTCGADNGWRSAVPGSGALSRWWWVDGRGPCPT